MQVKKFGASVHGSVPLLVPMIKKVSSPPNLTHDITLCGLLILESPRNSCQATVSDSFPFVASLSPFYNLESLQ